MVGVRFGGRARPSEAMQVIAHDPVMCRQRRELIVEHPTICDAFAAERQENEMSMLMVRQKVKDRSVAASAAAVRGLFATLARGRPAGVRYASTRVVDGSTFVLLTEMADGRENRRRAIPEFLRFLEQRRG